LRPVDPVADALMSGLAVFGLKLRISAIVTSYFARS
jgi:hypothetical protein